VRTHGKGEKTFAAHAVAALLNASHPDLDFYYTVDEVIQLVQAAYSQSPLDFEPTKNLFDEQNSDETYCPLD
jgi:hypothetical protein